MHIVLPTRLFSVSTVNRVSAQPWQQLENPNEGRIHSAATHSNVSEV